MGAGHHPLDLERIDPPPVKRASLFTQAASSSPPPVRRVSRPRPRAKPTVVPVKPPVPRLVDVELIQGSVRETFQFEVIPFRETFQFEVIPFRETFQFEVIP